MDALMKLQHYSVARWRDHVIVPAALSFRCKQRISNYKTNHIKVYFSHHLRSEHHVELLWDRPS